MTHSPSLSSAELDHLRETVRSGIDAKDRKAPSPSQLQHAKQRAAAQVRACAEDAMNHLRLRRERLVQVRAQCEDRFAAARKDLDTTERSFHFFERGLDLLGAVLSCAPSAVSMVKSTVQLARQGETLVFIQDKFFPGIALFEPRVMFGTWLRSGAEVLGRHVPEIVEEVALHALDITHPSTWANMMTRSLTGSSPAEEFEHAHAQESEAHEAARRQLGLALDHVDRTMDHVRQHEAESLHYIESLRSDAL